MPTKLLLILLAFFLFALDYANAEKNNTIDSTDSYSGRIFLKNGSTLDSKDIFVTSKYVIYKPNILRRPLDTLNISEVEFLRINDGSYALEIGIGAFLFGIVRHLSYEPNPTLKSSLSTGILVGGIGYLLGLTTSKSRTIYCDNIIDFTLCDNFNPTKDYNFLSTNLFCLTYHF